MNLYKQVTTYLRVTGELPKKDAETNLAFPGTSSCFQFWCVFMIVRRDIIVSKSLNSLLVDHITLIYDSFLVVAERKEIILKVIMQFDERTLYQSWKGIF